MESSPRNEKLIDLSASAAVLAEASRLLSASILSDSDEAISTYLAFVRATHARLMTTFSEYQEQIVNP